MNLRRYALIMAAATSLMTVPTCSTLSFRGEGSIESNPPPSPAVPSRPLQAEPLEVEPHVDLETVSEPPPVILELIDP